MCPQGMSLHFNRMVARGTAGALDGQAERNSGYRLNPAVRVRRDQGAESTLSRWAASAGQQPTDPPLLLSNVAPFSTSVLRYCLLQCKVGFWAGSDAIIWRRARLQDNRIA